MLRKGTLEDLEELTGLELLCFRRFWSQEDLRKEFEENPFSEVWLLEEDNRTIGYIIFWKIFEQASIVRIGILPEFRRSGYGQSILREILSRLKKEELEQVNLEVAKDNTAAIGLYEKLGFVPVSTIRNYYEDGTDAIRMICYLQV